MNRRPPHSTRTDTLFPYTTLFRSPLAPVVNLPARYPVLSRQIRHLHIRPQTFRRDPRPFRIRTPPPARRAFDHLQPTGIALPEDVQMDVHFAVSLHAYTSVQTGDLLA